jgi:hypothetical protein
MMTLDHNAYNAYLDRKLAHYNVWLLDRSRDIGKPYPGFPEDQRGEPARRKVVKVEMNETVSSAVMSNVVASVTAKASKPVQAKAPKAKKTSGAPTKQDLALEIFKRLGGVKAETIAAIQSELGMSAAGATTYFYNAKKIASRG